MKVYSFYIRKCISYYTSSRIIRNTLSYIRRYIMTTNIHVIHESVFLLYKTMYNKNICCHYISSYIMTMFVIIHESVFLII